MDSTIESILKINYHLVAGFLISKNAEMKRKGMRLKLNLKSEKFDTNIEEYKIIDLFSIIMDNAIEACKMGDEIEVVLEMVGSRFELTVKNPAIFVDYDLQAKMFENGFTTKKDKEKVHGIGLKKLKKLMNDIDGEIIIENELKCGNNLFCITLRL